MIQASPMKRTDTVQTGRGGFALMIVLLIVAIATTMALASVMTSTTKLLASQNLLLASRAQYTAESGLAHALQVLRADPGALDGSSVNPIGPFAMDQTGDDYTFWGLADADTPGEYRLYAEGRSGGVARTCSYTVFRSAGTQNSMLQGLVIGGSGASLPGSLEVYGDIHNNGDIFLTLAPIHGDVASHGTVMDPYHMIEGEVQTDADQIESEDISIEPYTEYSLSGQTCVAFEVVDDTFDADSSYCNGAAVTSGNLGGVVWLQGDSGDDVTITDGVEFRGTMLVQGNLIVDGRNIVITAEQGFPAIVTTGQLKLAPDCEATIDGVVMTYGGIAPTSGGRAEGSSTVINGGIMANWLGYDPTLRGNHELIYVAESCQLYDLSGTDSSAVTLRILEFN